MIGFWVTRGALRGASRSLNQRSSVPAGTKNEPGQRDNGAGAVIFVMLLPLLAAGFRAGYEGRVTLRLVTDYVVAFAVLMAVAMVVSRVAGARLRRQRRRATFARYAYPAPSATAGDMRRRAAFLRSLPDPSERSREQRLADLFSVSCPACPSPVLISCNMGIGIPVALVGKNPVTFCHLARMTKAVARGTARAQDVQAQFEGKVPEGVRL
jgi:hypothetical protein